MKKSIVFLIVMTLSTNAQCSKNLQILNKGFAGVVHLKDNVLEDVTFNGPTTLDHVNAKSIEVNGVLKFNDLSVSEDATLNGAVIGINGNFQTLTVMGNFKGTNISVAEFNVLGATQVENIKVTGGSDIKGSLQARNSHFKEIFIQAEDMHFQNVTATNVYVRSDGGRPQVLTLSGNDHILGNVTFESGKGVIKKSSSSQIKGTVKGALIQEINK